MRNLIWEEGPGGPDRLNLVASQRGSDDERYKVRHWIPSVSGGLLPHVGLKASVL